MGIWQRGGEVYVDMEGVGLRVYWEMVWGYGGFERLVVICLTWPVAVGVCPPLQLGVEPFPCNPRSPGAETAFREPPQYKGGHNNRVDYRWAQEGDGTPAPCGGSGSPFFPDFPVAAVAGGEPSVTKH